MPPNPPIPHDVRRRLEQETTATEVVLRVSEDLDGLDLSLEDDRTRAYEWLAKAVLRGDVALDRAEFARKCLADLEGRKRPGAVDAAAGVLALLVQRERPRPRYVQIEGKVAGEDGK